MRRYPTASILAVLTTIAFAEAAWAQVQQPGLPELKPPPPPLIKPYTAVPAKPPVPYADASYQNFRKQLADIAAKKDRAALAKIVVAKDFFWMQEKDMADPKKAGIDNLAKAINLDAKDGSGWEVIAGFVNDPTAADLPDKKGVICAPADPTVDSKAFENLVNTTQTDPSDWGYAVKDGIEVLAQADSNAPVVDRLGLNLVRVLPDQADQGANPPPFLHIATPLGKSGYVPMDTLAPLGGDEMCYTKDAGGWKVTGYFGGATQ
jgi:hypothetical protein